MKEFHHAIKMLGVTTWFEEIPGYIAAFVREFYTTISIKKGNSVVGKVRGKRITITADTIASFLGCTRPDDNDIEFPMDDYESPVGEELAKEICSEQGLLRYKEEKKFKQGMLSEKAAIMNKVIHNNIRPGGSEKNS